MGLLAVERWGSNFRGVHLREVHPAGAAAGELGQRPVLLRQAADELAGLLHDGQVRGEVGVQHIVHTQGAKKGHHFALHKSAGLHAELLAQRRAHGGRGADHHDLFRVGHRLPHRRALVPLGDAVQRADIGALAAVDADGPVPCLLQGVGAVHPHQVGAGRFAHAAADALVLPAEDAGVVRLDGHPDG